MIASTRELLRAAGTLLFAAALAIPYGTGCWLVASTIHQAFGPAVAIPALAGMIVAPICLHLDITRLVNQGKREKE